MNSSSWELFTNEIRVQWVEKQYMDEDTGSGITGGSSRVTLVVEREKALRT
jgi:hypothetical protein